MMYLKIGTMDTYGEQTVLFETILKLIESTVTIVITDSTFILLINIKSSH